MYNKIKREPYATDYECFEIKFYTADRLPCFGCQMFKKWSWKLGRMYQTAHQNDGFSALRLYRSKLNPACLCYDSPNQQNFMMSDSSSRTAKSASSRYFQERSSTVTFIWKFFFLQSRKSFEYFFCSHRTLGISPKDLEGFKADIALIYTTLVCSLAISTNLNFDLTFVTRNFTGSCVMRCAFWLVSRKDDCLEREISK